ncbi:hypothetical protein [Mesorhizobium sp.]|uniref:hypothetical protein n=1 Tax=Mesorhizobium sp. TaxID=1871066 RepID=UPI00121F5F10|nr:hypothetical protein [Mesorhizobium sp.]TIN82698.1 MAG: hypothetical protein E5X97_29495 [Mesorhizobium sp.]
MAEGEPVNAGPIARADGTQPSNGYLWPTESWWANDHFGHRGFTGRHHFGIVALSDGRWATEGFVYQIEANSDNPFGFHDRAGKPVAFATREKALRIAVARFVRLCRWTRRWKGTPDYLTEENCQKAINWALRIAQRPPIDFAPIAPAVPKPVPTGMPLFDHGMQA